MATVADYLGSGPEVLKSDLVRDVYPGEDTDAPKRDVYEFQREEAPDVELNPRQVQDNVFQKALNEEIDVNSFFDGPNKIDTQIVNDAIQANKAINLATTANQTLVNRQDLDAKINLFKNRYTRSVPTSDRLSTGIIETGSFPINIATGEVEYGDTMPASDDQNAFMKSVFPTNKTILDKKVKQEGEFMQWFQTQPDAPMDKQVQKIIARRVSPTFGGNLARRTYETVGFLNEGLMFYLPQLADGAFQKLQGLTGIGDPERDTWLSPTIEKELFEFRRSGKLSELLPDTDRHRILNDIIRDELRNSMSPEEFEAKGYNKKINVDGIEVFEKNFVTPQFASNVFEYAFDKLGFFEQVAMFLAEGAVAFKGVTAPVVIARRVKDAINGTQRLLHNRKYGAGTNVPFKIDTINNQVARSKSYALTHNVSVKDAAKEIMMLNTNEGRLARFSANRLANIVDKRFNYENVKAGVRNLQDQIDTKSRDLINARTTGNVENANRLTNEISLLKNRRNYEMYKVAGANAILVGLNPRQDLTIGMIQGAGRNMFASEENPQMGAFGEGAAVAGYLLFGGVKKFYNYQSGVKLPVVEDFIQNRVFQAKIGIENVANIMLAGYGKGMLVNPDLRNLNDLKDTLGLSISGIRTIDEFTKNALNLPKIQSDMIIKNLMESVQDIHLMTKDIPEQFRKGIQNKLVLSLADSSGIGVFHGVSQYLKMDELGFKKKDLLKFNNSVRRAMDVQDFGEERVNNFSALVESLKADILKLESAEGVAPEVIQRLKMTAGMYESAAVNQQLIFKKSLEQEIIEIDNFLEELKNPQNEALLSMWTEGDAVDNGLASLFKLRNKAESYLTRKEQDTFEYSNLTPSPDKGIYQQKQSVSKIASDLVNTVVETNKRLTLTDKQIDSVNNSNDAVSKVTKVIRTASDAKVEAAYGKIDPSQTIDFVNTGDNIFKMFDEFAKGYGVDISIISNPRTSPLLGNSAGRQLMNNIEGGAKRGLMKTFNDQGFIDIMNSTLTKDDTPFESGKDLYRYFKDQAQANPGIRSQFGLGENDTMSNFQLLQYMVQKQDLAFTADDFGFLASPLEFEKLRQSFQVFSKNQNANISSLGVRMVALLDQDFRGWGNSVDAGTFNDVIYARNIARLEKQRFDENTIGDQIEKASKGSPIKFLGIDGQETTITKSTINKLFDPMIDAIVKPTDRTAGFVKDEMKRFIATFASTSEQLPPNVLMKGQDGKVIEPTSSQLNSMVSPVFDITKEDGRTGLLALSETLQSLMYSKFISYKGMFNVADQIKNGENIDLNKMQTGNIRVQDTEGFNLPKAIPLPTQFKNYEEYIDAMEELIKVNVRRLNKDTGEIENIRIPAFDIRSMLKAEEGITSAIMSSKKFKETHKKFFDIVDQEAQVTKSAAVKQMETEQSAVYQKSRLYKENMSGDSFFSDVIMRGDPNSVDLYIQDLDRLVDAGEMTLEQSQKILQGLVVDVLRASGGESKNGSKFKFYNGEEIPISSYQTPEIPFSLLTAFDEIAEDGTRTALSIQSEKFNALMDAAGMSSEQKEVLVAMYRHSTKMDAKSVLARAKESGATTKGPNPGFTLNNTLSKAFNIARGMVSTEYVMAEMAIRYAALADGAILNTILNDERVSNTILNLMNDPTRVIEADADYFVRAVMKFSANAIKNVYGLTHDSGYNEETYWRSIGVVYPTQQTQIN